MERIFQFWNNKDDYDCNTNDKLGERLNFWYKIRFLKFINFLKEKKNEPIKQLKTVRKFDNDFPSFTIIHLNIAKTVNINVDMIEQKEEIWIKSKKK